MRHANACGLGGFGDVLRAQHLNGVETLATAFSKDADEVHDMVGTLDDMFDRSAVADIGLHHLNLADIAERSHVIGNFRLAHGNAHAIAALGETCDDRAPDKAGAAENGDQFRPVVDFVRFGLHPKLLHESQLRRLH